MDQPSSTVTSTAQPAAKPKRLLSLDALRGFDMFWIVSGEGIFHGLANGIKEDHTLVQNPYDWTIATNPGLSLFERILIGISNQLHHSPWNGFTFYDLIFPLFIFISGYLCLFLIRSILRIKRPEMLQQVRFIMR
ncbi:hypothetical protein [Pedobacter riviphilus]|uniref:hypothetical protein n=1 Tax=Pedobacter riviphilus TaxID=2766984 RepID=UPI001CC22047|nr:hypothetical protein [Pedobacter riviphilus]